MNLAKMIGMERKESPKGKDCRCEAFDYASCGCNADWSDNDPWNACIDELEKWTVSREALVAVMKQAENEYNESTHFGPGSLSIEDMLENVADKIIESLPTILRKQ